MVESVTPLLMKIVKAFPPNYRAINDVFNVRGRAVMFAYGGTIFNPSGISISPALQAHEAVHGERQGRDPAGWWVRYIADPRFRLDEEVPAHQAEYRWHARQAGAGQPVKGFRSLLAFNHHQIALRLSGPLYGGLISLAEAKTLVAA